MVTDNLKKTLHLHFFYISQYKKITETNMLGDESQIKHEQSRKQEHTIALCTAIDYLCTFL